MASAPVVSPARTQTVAGPGSSPGAFRTFGWVALLGTAALSVAWRLLSAARGSNLFTDDAYYYVIIARNFAATGRATFDGTVITNGFHPLLFVLEAAAFAAFGPQRSLVAQYLGLCLAFSALFLGTLIAALAGAWRSARDTPFAGIAALTAAVLLLPRFSTIYLDGMESALELPLLAVLGTATWKRRWSLAGAAGAAMLLARLDTLPFLVAPLIAAALWRERLGGRPLLRVALRMGLPPLAVLLGLTGVNLALTDHPLPISGAIKSTFPHLHIRAGNLAGNAEERLGLRVAVIGTLIGLPMLLRAGRLSRDLRWAGLTAAVLALCQIANLVLFQAWVKATPTWYLAILLPCGTLAAAIGFANLVGSGRGLRMSATAAIAVSLTVNLIWICGRAGRLGTPLAPTLPFGRGAGSEAAAFVRWIAGEPRALLWAATDCGTTAFWSDRRFVNLDGLVNDFHYQDILARHQLRDYLANRGVDRLVFGAWDQSPVTTAIEPVYRSRLAPAVFSGNYQAAPFYLYSYVHHTWSDTLFLPRSSELWRSGISRDGEHMARTVVFDMGPELR